MEVPYCPHCGIPCTDYNGVQITPTMQGGKLMTRVLELWTCADVPTGCGSTMAINPIVREPTPAELVEWAEILNGRVA